MSFVNDFTIPLVAGEPYYYLGLVNVAQQFVFEAMEAVPDYRKSVRCFKRLAETNLINGRYEVARNICVSCSIPSFIKIGLLKLWLA